MQHDARSRTAFTLIEVMVALVVGTIVIAGVRSVLVTLLDQAERIESFAELHDAEANGERLLRALVREMDLGSTGEATFTGNEREVRFTTWCRVADGWKERCAIQLVALRPESVGGRAGVVALLPKGEVAMLLQTGSPPEFAYLLDPGAGGSWVRRWGSGIAPPTALGIVTAQDTLILRIGERG